MSPWLIAVLLVLGAAMVIVGLTSAMRCPSRHDLGNGWRYPEDGYHRVRCEASRHHPGEHYWHTRFWDDGGVYGWLDEAPTLAE